MASDYTTLPPDLPAPSDDGRAAHLPGRRMPGPGVDLPEGWDAIPGARGCSTEACNFRDHHEELRRLGAADIYGLSSQSPQYQAEVVERLHLPFQMLSDPDFTLAEALDLPTFEATGHPMLYSRLTLIVRDGYVEHVFYPIFRPNTHAQQVCAWLDANPL